MSARIGVVVPHYDDERRLRWVLNALAQQTYPRDLLQVVVADDGSPRTPVLPDLPFHSEVVRQEDLGFRAAAARNLGATAVLGELLVFLDGDTIPAPGYLSAMDAAFERTGPGMLAVGRREHVDLTDCTDQDVAAWVRDGVPASRVLPAPSWLRNGYARTNDLRDAGDEDFRLVISAVLAIDRQLYERAGGFDASITGYGGEDWELAWRCWLLGARLRHVPGAVAWHDGPEAGERTGDRSAARTVKDAESLALAARITLPSVRGRGLVWDVPDIAVELHGRPSAAQLFLTAQSLLRDADAGIWLVDLHHVPPALAADPRIHAGPLPDPVRVRVRHQVDVWTPLRVHGTLAAACAAGEIRVPGALRIRHTRQRALGAPEPTASALPTWVQELPDEGVERLLGRWSEDE